MYYEKDTAVEILSHYLRQILTEKTVILCVGTDRCVGDILGPLVGTLLKEKNFRFPVYGTMAAPVHAMNLKESIEKIDLLHPIKLLVVIDACLGIKESIGIIRIKKGPIFPGKAVGKRLPPIGDISITGIVDEIRYDNFYPIYNVRFDFIQKIAEVITESLMLATYLS